MLRDKLFGDRTVVLTSATLALGGTFDGMAAQWGLGKGDDWSGLDVGSPSTTPARASSTSPSTCPSRAATACPTRTSRRWSSSSRRPAAGSLGLFSSMRAAKAATEALRDRLSVPLLCQGDDSTSLLVKQFAADPETCLFGTLSLWQGVDVPGPSLTCVIIDRIPSPAGRPADVVPAAPRGGEGRQRVHVGRGDPRGAALAQGAGGCCGRWTTAG